MELQNFCISSFVLLICIIPSAVHGGLEYGPLNTADIVGATIVLRCRTDGVATTNVRWYEYVTNPSGSLISDGNLTLSGHPNSARYSLILTDSRTFDLQISPIVLADGGFYLCTDSNAVPPSIVQLGAQLVTLASEPVCESTIPRDGFVIEGQYFSIECNITFQANYGIAPLMTYTGPGEFKQAYTTTNTTAWAGLGFTVNRTIEGQNFRCTTNFSSQGFVGPDRDVNPPSYEHIMQGNQLWVQWAPTGLYASPIQATYEIGQSVTCYADAYPPATYLWQSMRTSVVWNSQSFTTTEDMVGYQLMRCQAKNTIRNTTYSGDLFIDVYVNARTTTPTPTTTPSTTPVPEFADCDDLTGRWEAVNPNASLCLVVDHANDAQLIGLFLNSTLTYWLQIAGRTREGKYDESGWSVIWPSASIGVTSFAAECKKCYGTEILLADGISRTTKDSAFCASGNDIQHHPTYTFKRVATSWPCSSSATLMAQHLDDEHLAALNKEWEKRK